MNALCNRKSKWYWSHRSAKGSLGLIFSISWFLLEVLVSWFTCAVYGFCWIMLFMYLFLDSWVCTLVLPVGFIKLILEVLGDLQLQLLLYIINNLIDKLPDTHCFSWCNLWVWCYSCLHIFFFPFFSPFFPLLFCRSCL